MASANDGLDAVIADVVEVWTLLDKVPSSNARHTHNDTCHTVRAQCLAEKIRDILDGSE